MGNVDGDERDAGTGNFVADDRGRILIDLELNDKIDMVAHEFIRIAHGDGGIVMVVEHQQVHPAIGQQQP